MGDASDVGAVLFGVVVGWVTYRTLVRRSDEATLSDIATVVGAVGGGAVVALFNNPHLFGLYSIVWVPKTRFQPFRVFGGEGRRVDR
jgi:uncharacterized membrane protein YeaQ/YmgE (transglycosylase-associated protein family)